MWVVPNGERGWWHPRVPRNQEGRNEDSALAAGTPSVTASPRDPRDVASGAGRASLELEGLARAGAAVRRGGRRRDRRRRRSPTDGHGLRAIRLLGERPGRRDRRISGEPRPRDGA